MTPSRPSPDQSAVPPAPTSEAARQRQSWPDLRKVPVELLSPVGWLSGMFHVPVHQTLVEFLSLTPRQVKLTRVRIPNEPDPRPFVALQRDAITLVAPSLEDGVEARPDPGYTALREVACLLPTGILRGSLAVLLNMRLSDHLQQQGLLLTLRRCLLTPYGQTVLSPDARALSTVIVNLNAVLGVSEET
jgi:hypothetical protein